MKTTRDSVSILGSGLLINLLLPPIITQLTATDVPNASVMEAEDVSVPAVDIIKNNGYDVQVHEVVTQDGYILELHRIPRSKSNRAPTRAHPVFIHHGILGSSADWVLGGAGISLPMQLADDGYDVWLANCRGNTYSRKHVSMTYKQKAYWNFSLHEIGKYDLPASIDYILANTSTKQVHYIGFSMGSCVFFIMGSVRPEYQPKIRSQISLAPVAFLANTRSTLRYIAPYAKLLNIMFQRISKGMLLPQSKFQSLLANTFCRERMMQKLICEKCFIFSVCGSDPHNFNSNLIPLIMGHFPAGTSSMLAAHFAQFIIKDTFGQYDYGPVMNMQHYNTTEPPTYDLKSIRVPVTLIYGENDILADTEDVIRLRDELPELMTAFAPDDPYFNHVDFLWSLRVNDLINEPVKRTLATTDDPAWRYTGPDPRVETNEIDGGGWKKRKGPSTAAVTAAAGGPAFLPVLEFLAEHLDAIVADTMPQRLRDGQDMEEFARESQLQVELFAGVVQRLIKAVGDRYGRLRDDVADEVAGWTDDVRTSAAGARATVETGARRTAVLVTDTVTGAGRSAAGGVAVAERFIVGGVTAAESAVTGSVAKAEHFVVGGVAAAESAVTGGVAKAERFVVGGVVAAEGAVTGGVAKAERFVLSGVNKADRAVSGAVNVTFRALNKAFWFLK